MKIFLLNIFKYEISRKKIKGKKKIIVQKSCQMFVIASAESDNDCGGTLADMEMAKQQKKKIEKKIIILQTFSRVTTSYGPRLLKNLYFLSIHHHGLFPKQELLFYYLQVYSCFHVLMSFLICFFLNQSGRFVL